MLNIGFRAHDFGSFNSARELASAIARVKSPAMIQLALNKVIPSAKGWKQWDDEYISAITDDLDEKGVKVAVVGCYINPVHPDKDERENQLTRFKKSLSLTKAFKCSLVATETGSWTNDISYSSETYEEHVFQTLLRSLDVMLNEAVKQDAYVGIEPVAFPHTMCTIERSMRVLDYFKDEHLKLLFDPINLVPRLGIPEIDGSYRRVPTLEAQERFYTSALDAFGHRLCALHCKDYTLSNDGIKKGDLCALTGVFAWSSFFKEIKKREIDVPILLENFDKDKIEETLSELSKI